MELYYLSFIFTIFSKVEGANLIMSFWDNSSFVGVFNLEGNTLDIVDPYLSPMSILMDKIPSTNKKTITIRNCIGGVYYVYHIFNEYGQTQFLVAIHSSFQLSALGTSDNEFRGHVSSALSGEIAIVEPLYRYDTSYCYYALEEDAYYDAETVLDSIDSMPYSEEIKQNIRNMVTSKMDQDLHPQGRDFIEILGELPIWDGFRKMGVKSTQWYQELSRMLLFSYKTANTIMGGVVSKAEKGMLPCVNYTAARNMTFAISIGLNDSKQYY